MPLPVLTAVGGSWEAPLVAGLEHAADVRVVRRCADLAELISVADAGVGRAAVVSSDLHRLDREAVARLVHAGVAVIGVADPGDPAAADRLRAIGIGRVAATDAPPAEVAALVVAAVAGLAEDAAALVARGPSGLLGSGRADGAGQDARRGSSARGVPPAPLGAAARHLGDPADALDGLPRLPLVAADGAVPLVPSEPGRVVAVWGPTGAPGRTTVAVGLAAELAAAGASTVVADADTYGPSVAQVLALLDESAGLAAAVRAAGTGALDAPRLARLAPVVAPNLRVLTGLARTSRWPELRAAGLDAVWSTCRAVAAWTVVDCGFALEADEELAFDSAAPRRNAATLSALAAADVVLAVGGADPVGLQRLVRGLSDLAEVLGPAGPAPLVVVTRVRASAVGPRPEQRIRDALARYAGVDRVHLVPDDRSALDAAMLAGRTLVESAPGSPARAALAELARLLPAVGGPTAPSPRAAPSMRR